MLCGVKAGLFPCTFLLRTQPQGAWWEQKATCLDSHGIWCLQLTLSNLWLEEKINLYFNESLGLWNFVKTAWTAKPRMMDATMQGEDNLLPKVRCWHLLGKGPPGSEGGRGTYKSARTKHREHLQAGKKPTECYATVQKYSHHPPAPLSPIPRAPSHGNNRWC